MKALPADLGGQQRVDHHQQQQQQQQHAGFPTDRMGMFLVVSKYARGLAFLLMVAAYIGQQQQTKTSEHKTTTNNHHSKMERWLLGFVSEQSAVLVLIYALIVKLVVSSSSSSSSGMNKYGITQMMIQDSITTSAAVTRVSSRQTMMRIRSTVSASSMRLFSLAGGGGGGDAAAAATKEALKMAISESESFLALDEIAQMTLLDIRNLFRYAVELGGRSFDRTLFTNKVSRRCQQAIHAMDEVTLLSRGGAPFSTGDRSEQPDQPMDALHFAAAVRIFAEWRTVRLVPDATSARYSFGMSMARRDLILNVRKLEAAAHDWMKHHRHRRHHRETSFARSKSSDRLATTTTTTTTTTTAAVTSPTLRQLLQHEVAQNIHPARPRLHDKSAASGLLWAKRQLQYQTLVFANLSQIPTAYPNAKSAVLAAYQSTYENYHGFLVRNVFQSSFDAAPPADTILKFMNLPSKMYAKENGVSSDDNDDVTVSEFDGDESWCQFPVEASEEEHLVRDEQRHSSSFRKLPPLHEPNTTTTTTTTTTQRTNPLHDVGQHLQNELIKIADFFGQCAGHPRSASHDRSRDILNDVDAVDKNPPRPMATQAQRDDLADFVVFMQEILLEELDQLIAEFNMNDPSKV